VGAKFGGGTSNGGCCARSSMGAMHDKPSPAPPSYLLTQSKATFSAAAMKATTARTSVASGLKNDNDDDDDDDDAFDSSGLPFVSIEFADGGICRSHRQARISTENGQERQRTAAAFRAVTASDDLSSLGATSYDGDKFIFVAPKQL